MLLDRTFAAVYRERTSQGLGIDIVLDAWSGFPPDYRAAILAAQGDLRRAALWGGGGWASLANGNIDAALREARLGDADDPTVTLLKAEALLAAGAIVAGLEVLEQLHEEGDTAGTLALARRRYLLGDHSGALSAASELPMHAGAALIGARASLAQNRPDPAFRMIEPFLAGAAPLPEPATAGAMAVVAASIMARKGSTGELESFAAQLRTFPTPPGEMLATLVRVMWIGGMAAAAWEQVKDDSDSWMLLARLELAVLAGNAKLASNLLERAGPLGVVAAPGVALLRGEAANTSIGGENRDPFAPDLRVHIWRTHPYRWRPWIDAALRTPADVSVFDLAANDVPNRDDIPQVVLDDGSLVTLLRPVPVTTQPRVGNGVWIEHPLCRGIGIGHDWPVEESSILRAAVSQTSRKDAAMVKVVSGESALAQADEGRPMVVVAPPGDPFWNGPFPERAWPVLRIVRADPRNGWRGAGARVAEAAGSLSTVAPEGEA